jgi:hypothetical protein
VRGHVPSWIKTDRARNGPWLGSLHDDSTHPLLLHPRCRHVPTWWNGVESILSSCGSSAPTLAAVEPSRAPTDPPTPTYTNTSSGLYVRDMSTRTPGEPVNLGTYAGAIDWSGDSLSLFLADEEVMLDPNDPAPIRRAVATYLHAWAPSGNRFAYTDASGLRIVDVVEGLPGSSTLVMPDATNFVWSKDPALLAAWVDGGLSLIDLSGPSPVVTEITAPSPGGGEAGASGESRTITAVSFSADNAHLAYIGAQTRSARDLYVVDVGSSSPRLVNAPLTGGAYVGSFQWAPQGSWLWYWVSTDTVMAVDVSGGTPMPLPSLSNYAWVPGRTSLFGKSNGQLMLVDATDPGDTPVELSQASVLNFSMGGPDTAIAYFVQFLGLMLDDFANDPEPRTNVGFLEVVARQSVPGGDDARVHLLPEPRPDRGLRSVVADPPPHGDRADHHALLAAVACAG